MNAEIIYLEDMAKLIKESQEDNYTWVVASGGFDPIHSGHINYLQEASKIADNLIVVVNGDNFLRVKKGKPFMPLEERCKIVSSIKGVSFVIPFEYDKDQTVCCPLEVLKPNYFAKGGDRFDSENIPEWKTCIDNGVMVVINVGGKKKFGSSDFLKGYSN